MKPETKSNSERAKAPKASEPREVDEQQLQRVVGGASFVTTANKSSPKLY